MHVKQVDTKSHYSCSISVNTTAKDALAAICRVKDWWAKNLQGNTENLHDEFTVRFGTTWKTFRITALVPGKKVTWTVTDCNMPWNPHVKEWKDSVISWEVNEAEGNTKITFTQYGLPAMHCGEVCMNAWDGFIKGSLYKLITTGKGNPN